MALCGGQGGHLDLVAFFGPCVDALRHAHPSSQSLAVELPQSYTWSRDWVQIRPTLVKFSHFWGVTSFGCISADVGPNPAKFDPKWQNPRHVMHSPELVQYWPIVWSVSDRIWPRPVKFGQFWAELGPRLGFRNNF